MVLAAPDICVGFTEIVLLIVLPASSFLAVRGRTAPAALEAAAVEAHGGHHQGKIGRTLFLFWF
jgi:hypothetical protein